MEPHNKSGRNIQQTVDSETLNSQLAASMKNRLLLSNYKDVVQARDVLIPKIGRKKLKKNNKFREKEIRTLTNKFHLNERNKI